MLYNANYTYLRILKKLQTAILITLISILITFFCIIGARYYYAVTLDHRANQTVLNQFSASNSLLLNRAPNKKRIVLLGDSRISRWTSLPQIDGYECINRGIGGDTTNQSLLRLDRDVLILNPDIVLVQLGINDLKAIGVLPDKKLQIINQTLSNLMQILEILTKRDIHVFIMTVLPAAKPSLLRQIVWSDNIGQAVSDINDNIRKISHKCITVIDVDSIFSNEGKMSTQYSEDTLHLNEYGYMTMNHLLQQSLTTFDFKKECKPIFF